MAVMSLVADPEDLFDAKSGIYGNGIKYEEYLANGGLKDGEVLNNYTDADGREWHRYMASNAFYTGKEWEKRHRCHILMKPIPIVLHRMWDCRKFHQGFSAEIF